LATTIGHSPSGRALRSSEYWLLPVGCVVAVAGAGVWIVVPMLVAGLSISSLPQYVALWKRAQRAGVGGAWWRTVTLSMLNNLAASCGAFVLGVVFRLIWIWGVKRG
jgi:hypothetical protein